MASAHTIHIDSVVKRYKKHCALNNLSLTIPQASSVAIVGNNGAGKTTLLRCLLDFAKPDQGSIRINGITSDDPSARQSLSYLPERFLPPSYLTGYEAMALLFGLHGLTVTRDELHTKLSEFEFPLEALTRQIRNYSKGMTQKLGLACVILTNKPWLVLDEPMSGLDPAARRRVVDTIQQARNKGQGLVFTTHSLQDLDQLCDQIAIIHAGELKFYGSPSSFLGKYPGKNLEAAFLEHTQLANTTLQ